MIHSTTLPSRLPESPGTDLPPPSGNPPFGGDGRFPGGPFPDGQFGLFETGIPAISWKIYGIASLLALVAFFDLGIPRIIIFALSIIIFVPLIAESLRSSLPILTAMVVYIPYSKAISGNMGGAVSGLNFTTVLTGIALLSLPAVFRNNRNGFSNEFFQPDSALVFDRSFRRLLILFCLLGAFSVLHTDMVFADWTFFTALVDYKRWIDPFLIFFFFSYLVRTEKEARILVTVMAINLAIIGLGSIWQHHEIGAYSHRIRLKGIAGQANTMGAFYANYFFILLGFIVMKFIPKKNKILFSVGMIGCFLGLMATESRGDALALVMGVLIFFFFQKRSLFFAMVGGLIFLAINIQFLPEGLRARIQHTVTQRSSDGFSEAPTLDASARTRLALWTGAINMIRDHPIIGVGYKLFQEYIFSYVPHNAETDKLPLKRRDAHNAYFLIGAEMGIPTLLVFLTLLVNMLRVTYRSYKASIDPFWKTISLATMCSVISLIITNMFGSRVVSLILAGYLWGLLAILLKVPAWQNALKTETPR